MNLSMQEIARLTLTQVLQFLKSIEKMQTEELKVMSTAMRVSALGDDNSFTSFLKGLDSTSDKKEKVLRQSDDFDWKKEDSVARLEASNRSKEFFDNYFKKHQKKSNMKESL